MSRFGQKVSLCACLVLALFCFGQSTYIHVKAQLAQVLLERAWARSEQMGVAQKPWPWADVKPVALLSVPALGIQQFVLDSHAGEALAFGPGMVSKDGGLAAVRVLAGHRDTHFAFLKDLDSGDEIELKLLGKPLQRFRIQKSEILDAREDALPLSAFESTLFMVTCYPFDSVSPRGPLRYVLTAVETSVEAGDRT